MLDKSFLQKQKAARKLYQFSFLTFIYHFDPNYAISIIRLFRPTKTLFCRG